MVSYILGFTFLTVLGIQTEFESRLEERKLGNPYGNTVAECLEELGTYVNVFNWTNNDNYAAMFLANAWGLKAMGNYEQCMLHGGTFCMDTVGPQQVCSSLVIGGNGCCIPKSCEGTDIEKQVSGLFCSPIGTFGALESELERLNVTTVIGIHIKKIMDMLPPVLKPSMTCGQYSKPLTAGSIGWMLFMFFLLVIVLLASLPKYLRNIYCSKMHKRQLSPPNNGKRLGQVGKEERIARHTYQPSEDSAITEGTITGKLESPLSKLESNSFLKSFQFQANWDSLVTYVPRKTSFLDGIRFWSFAWVVLGHTAACQGFMGFDNFETVLTYYAPRQLWFSIFELQGVLAVDTFFWLGSFLTGYLLPKKLIKMKVKFHDIWYFVPVLIVRRWLRIMPSCLFVLFCFWQLFPLMVFGPKALGQILEDNANWCSTAWWKYSLQLGTVLNLKADLSNAQFLQCQGWYWYMQTEVYMYYIAVFIVAFYIWNKHIAMGMSIFCALLFTMVAWNQAWVLNQSYQGMFYYHEWSNPTKSIEAAAYYFRFWNRAGVYFVGLTAGFVFRELDLVKHKISACVSTCLQVFSCLLLFLICSILFTDIKGPPKDHKVFDLIGKAGWTDMGEAAYLGFARPCWGIGLSILAYSFIYKEGRKGFLNQMLSLPVYAPLGKLTFLGYLIHLDWIQLFSATEAGLWEHYTPISQIRNCFGYLTISLLSAFVIYMIWELPLAKIERLLFEGERSHEHKGTECYTKLKNESNQKEDYKVTLLENA